MKAYIEGIGVYAQGLQGWRDAQAVMRGERTRGAQPLARYKPALLPANERRRATDIVRIAFGACEDAIGERTGEARQLAAVFASSGGDYAVHDRICRTLLDDEPMVSPTLFHNSVHNAAAGYWSIATGAMAPSVSLSAFDDSVAAGLLEAMPLLEQDGLPCLLVCADCEVAGPMRRCRPIEESFACALWLAPERSANALASIEVTLHPQNTAETACGDPGLERLRRNNPAARILPLLHLLASGGHGEVRLARSAGGSVRIDLGAT